MPELPSEFIQICQELYTLRSNGQIGLHHEAATASIPAHMRVLAAERPDFTKCLYIYPDAQDANKCTVQTVPMLRMSPYTAATANVAENIANTPPPAEAAQVILELKDLCAHVTKVLELNKPFLSRLTNELSDLIKHSQVNVTPTGKDQAVIKCERRRSAYIVARAHPEMPETLFVDLQPKTSRALGEATVESNIPWAVLAQFVQTNLIPPTRK